MEVKESDNNKKNKLNHRQNYKIPPRNSFEIFTIEEYQDKLGPINEESSTLSSFDHATSKRRHKKKSSQPRAYITNN